MYTNKQKKVLGVHKNYPENIENNILLFYGYCTVKSRIKKYNFLAMQLDWKPYLKSKILRY